MPASRMSCSIQDNCNLIYGDAQAVLAEMIGAIKDLGVGAPMQAAA